MIDNLDLCTLAFADGYKLSHAKQYPEGTTRIFSNLTARKSRVEGQNQVVFFGLYYFINVYLRAFINDLLDEAKWERYELLVKRYVGVSPDKAQWDALREYVEEKGHLPLIIRAVDEGTLVPIQVPMLTIHNTEPEFFWLTNYFETLLSAVLWKPITSATTAFRYRMIMESYARATCEDNAHVPFQCHDFSFRGLSSVEDACVSGSAHLTAFSGTDTLPAIDFVEQLYSDPATGFSVPATEHSVMCAGGQADELETFRRLITKVHPTGIVSIVSDTWDFWKVMTEYLPMLKEEIEARDGKVVIRPDSGDPFRIICGYYVARTPEEANSYIDRGIDVNDIAAKDGDRYYKILPANSEHGYPYHSSVELSLPEVKGAMELLTDVFGSSINRLGYKVINPKVGLIYGDSITVELAGRILERMKDKRFASSNIVFGVGSYTYQYVTRDTYGMAMKATYAERYETIGEDLQEDPTLDKPVIGVNIFKKPITDPGKNSATGLLMVYRTNEGELTLKQQCSWEEVNSLDNQLRLVYSPQHRTMTDFATVRTRIDDQIIRLLDGK